MLTGVSRIRSEILTHDVQKLEECYLLAIAVFLLVEYSNQLDTELFSSHCVYIFNQALNIVNWGRFVESVTQIKNMPRTAIYF